MTCQDIENILSDYLEDNLSQGEREGVRVHLASCHPCRKMVEEVSWLVESCGQFPVIEPPELLKGKILERTSRARSGWNFLQTFFPARELQRLSPVYFFATAIMIFLIVGVILNAYGIVKRINRYTHQAYSTGVRIYYHAEELKEDISNLKEDFPNSIDKGFVMGVDWIKDKMDTEEKEEKKGKKGKG
ncbi:MAG: zf-HC2 domain-containing protein [Acidobacteriota bacterium]